MGKQRIIDKTKAEEFFEMEEEKFKAEAKEKEEKKSKKLKKKVKKKKGPLSLVKKGQIYIQSTYNNTIISVTDLRGNVLAWASAGAAGFKGPKKATPYAAGVVVRDVIEKVKDRDFQEANVFVKGIGASREAAIRALAANGIQISSIRDVTTIPHNGCRPPKPRRV